MRSPKNYMRLPDFLKTPLLAGILPTLGVAVVFLLGTIFHGVKPTFLAAVLPKIPRESILALAVLLGLASFLLLLWVLYLHLSGGPADRLRGHEFVPRTGISIDKKNGKRCCTRCMLQGNLIAPLGISGPEEDGTWICMIPACMSIYVEPKEK